MHLLQRWIIGSVCALGIAAHALAATLAVSPATETLIVGGTRTFTIKSDSSSLPPPVAWSVSGVSGGNSTVGTISAGGLYTAPAALPTNNPVTVTATTTDGSPAKSEIAWRSLDAPPGIPATS